MAIDPVAISAIIISVIGALGTFINKTHLQRIKCCGVCIDSDCRTGKNNSRSSLNIEDIIETPPKLTPKIHKKNIEFSDV